MGIPNYPTRITVEDLDAAGAIPEGYRLLDIRENDEWAAGHAPDALHVPMTQITGRLGDLPEERLLVICRSGNRSARVSAWLNQNGYDAWDVGGGMQAWIALGLDIVRDDGGPAAVL